MSNAEPPTTAPDRIESLRRFLAGALPVIALITFIALVALMGIRGIRRKRVANV